MSVRVSPLGLAILIFIIALFNSIQGLAGSLSRIMVLLPILVVTLSFIQVWYTYLFFGFHQDFSTDHPVRGEELSYTFVIHHHGILPACGIQCQFSFKGPGLAGTRTQPVFLAPRAKKTWSFTFRCAYRGIYAVGIERFLFRDTLGLLQLSFPVEPRMFYVYPELLALPPSLDSFFIGSGELGLGSGGVQDDIGVFDSIYPLRHGEGARQIAWKRFAATGIPSAYRTAKASAPALRVVLDLRPAPSFGNEEDRLTAEDLAVSLVFSVLRYMAERGLPVEFYGGAETAEPSVIPDLSAFEWLYNQSTSLLFNETTVPPSAWTGDSATLLVTLQTPMEQALDQTLEQAEENGYDLYAALEHRLRSGYRMLIISVPAPALVDEARTRALTLLDHLPMVHSWVPYKVLDTRLGNEGIAHVFE